MKTSTHFKPLLFWLITAVLLILSMAFVNSRVGYAQEAEEATDTSLTPRSPSSYPADPTGDINWSGGTSGVADIQNAFNNGRSVENSQLGTSVSMLTLPAQSEWDGMSDNEKALWLINRERIDRGVMPLHDVEGNVTGVATYYANYLLDNDAWGHYEDGNSPWQRLNNNPTINGCHDSLNVAENLAVFVTSGNSIALPIERSIYMWMYDDAGNSWGHRHAILWYPYNDNSGASGMEGFLGIGRANGGPYQGPFSSQWNFAEMIVMNVFDPCASWQYPSSVTSITPAYGENTGTIHITNLAGTDFVTTGTTAVSLQKSGETPIAATNVTVVSTSKITADFNLTGAAIGDWDVVVVNPDGMTGTLADGFAVQGPPPIVTSITPAIGENTRTIHITDLAGANFLTDGVTAVELRKSGQSSIIATNVSVVNGSQISCDVNLAGAAIGDWDVVVTNPDDTVGTLANGFTVTIGPSVTSITPIFGENTGSISITDLAGADFVTTGITAVSLQKSGETPIAATNVTVVSTSQISCDFDLTGETIGSRDVVVTNPDGTVGVLEDGFRVSGAMDNHTFLPIIMKPYPPIERLVIFEAFMRDT